MQFEDANWMDIEAYLTHDDRVMIVLGACEQHGYLSLETDTKIPLALANAASQKTGVLAAPTLNFGVSPYFTTYPGTISLRASTFMDVVEDIIRSLYKQGFKRFLILNGHGGNDPVRARLIELSNELDGLKFAWYAWWVAPNVTAAAARYGLKSYHAAWIEAFSFVRVSELPQGEKVPPVVKRLLSARETRETYGDGVYGGPYQVDDAIMTEILDTALSDVLELLEF
jgi:creatinine amidohydrolase